MPRTKLILATKNAGKIAELRALLAPFEMQALSAADIPLPDVEETGQTFAENALLKAKSAAKAANMAALADDSGLCVDALGGAPGVLSARYGGFEKLLVELADIPAEKRSAHFICCLCLVTPQDDVYYFEGRVDGSITLEPKGQGGFGYDPVFVPQEGDGRTYAEMTREEKAQTSHRARALARFIQALTANKIAF